MGMHILERCVFDVDIRLGGADLGAGRFNARGQPFDLRLAFAHFGLSLFYQRFELLVRHRFYPFFLLLPNKIGNVTLIYIPWISKFTQTLANSFAKRKARPANETRRFRVTH